MTAAAISYVLTTTAVVPQQQADISDAIADELDRPCTELKYQLILLDTLRDITIAQNLSALLLRPVCEHSSNAMIETDVLTFDVRSIRHWTGTVR